MVKKAAALALVAVLCIGLLCSCGEADYVGTWSGSYIYNGATFYRVLTINDDHTFVDYRTKDGVPRTEYGTWKVENNELKCTPNGSLSSYVWKLENGKLSAGAFALTKE